MQDAGGRGAKRRSSWRLGHGAVFFVFLCLLVIVAALTIFGGLDMLKVVTEARIASETESPEPEGWLE